MADGNGHQAEFNVEFTGPARSELRALARRAVYARQGPSVAEALRQLLDRLTHDPKELGEPMYYLRSMKMQVRRAGRGPIYIEYGVHTDRPIVIVRRVVGLAEWA